MQNIVLFHHDPSPYGERIRKCFGLQNIPWKSCLVPMVMPRPDMTMLSGGYRKIPVMQYGADIYCDTRLISQKINNLFNDLKLFSHGTLQNSALQSQSDQMFRSGAILSLIENKEYIPPEVVEDRMSFFTFINQKTAENELSHHQSQFKKYAQDIDDQLRENDFILGLQPNWADICCYANIFMAKGNIPSSFKWMKELKNIDPWYQNLVSYGEGIREEISSQEALEIAKTSTPDLSNINHQNSEDENMPQPGDNVKVTPDDYGQISVRGELICINSDEIVVTNETKEAGAIAIHFPRLGFIVEKII